jgi:hypothetical protein
VRRSTTSPERTVAVPVGWCSGEIEEINVNARSNGVTRQKKTQMKRNTAGNCWQRPSSFESLLASGQETWPFTWLSFKDRLQHGGRLLAIGALLARSQSALVSTRNGTQLVNSISPNKIFLFQDNGPIECFGSTFHQHVNVFAIRVGKERTAASLLRSPFAD